MSTLTPIWTCPSRLLVSLSLVLILTLSACTPLPDPAMGLTSNSQPAAPTPDPLTDESWGRGTPETPADAATGLPVGQAFVDLSSNGAPVPQWMLSADEVEHVKTLLDRLPSVECPPMAEPAGYRGMVVVLGAGDVGVRHAYDGWVWRGSPAAMNPQTTCQLDPGREVERFLLSSAQPYLDSGVFSTIAAELNLPLPTPLVTPPSTATAAPAAVATAVSAQPAGDLLPPTNGLAHTWRDYETALVRAILPPTLANGVCDWQVLGHTGQEVYVWAFCAAYQAGADTSAASVPAVLSMADDGHTVTARIPREGSYYPEDVRAMFPPKVQQQVFDRLPEATLSRLEQHARRLTLPTLPPLGAAETIKPRPGISATGAHIDLYSGRSDNPAWELNELDLEQLDALLEGLPVVDCPAMPGQLGYRGVIVGLGHADESRLTAYAGTLWFGYAGVNPRATCLADQGRAVERFLLGSAQPYLDPKIFNAITAGLVLPVPTPLVTPTPAPTLAPGFVRDADEVLGLQFTRPARWEPRQVTGLSRAYCVAGPPTENPVAPPAFYFTVVPPGFLNEDASAYNWWSRDELAAAFAAGIGEQFTSPRAPAGYEEHHTYTRLADVTVDGFSAIVVENERPWAIAAGTKDRRVLVRLVGAVLVVGAYYTIEEELRDFVEVVTSFRIGTTLRVRAANLKSGD